MLAECTKSLVLPFLSKVREVCAAWCAPDAHPRVGWVSYELKEGGSEAEATSREEDGYKVERTLAWTLKSNRAVDFARATYTLFMNVVRNPVRCDDWLRPLKMRKVDAVGLP